MPQQPPANLDGHPDVCGRQQGQASLSAAGKGDANYTQGWFWANEFVRTGLHQRRPRRRFQEQAVDRRRRASSAARPASTKPSPGSAASAPSTPARVRTSSTSGCPSPPRPTASAPGTRLTRSPARPARSTTASRGIPHAKSSIDAPFVWANSHDTGDGGCDLTIKTPE